VGSNPTRSAKFQNTRQGVLLNLAGSFTFVIIYDRLPPSSNVGDSSRSDFTVRDRVKCREVGALIFRVYVLIPE